MLQCVAVCCSELQCVAVCCSVLHVLQCVAGKTRVLQPFSFFHGQCTVGPLLMLWRAKIKTPQLKKTYVHLFLHGHDLLRLLGLYSCYGALQRIVFVCLFEALNRRFLFVTAADGLFE